MQERRVLPRWQISRPFLYTVLGKGTSMSAGFLQDINLIGAKAYLKTPVALQSQIRLEIKIPDQEVSVFGEGIVVWQNRFIAKGFPTGIRFTLLKPEDKERILKHFDDQIRKNWWANSV